jgi:hypothetical protein
MAAPRGARTKWVAAVLLAAACGCGSSQATVSGKVRYQGRPVVYGSVTFLSPDKVSRSAAIQPDGSYTVEGLTPGEAWVSVTSRDPAKGRARKGQGKEAPDGTAGWFPLPRRFETPAGSGLSHTLSAGANAFDIELK